MASRDNQEDQIRAKAMRGVRAIFDRYHLIATSQNYAGFDLKLMKSLKLIDATYTPHQSPLATCTFELLIDASYTNLNNVMHGGAGGVIFDMCTVSSLGPLAKPGYWDFMGGVTRCLNLCYLRAVPVGTTVRIHSEVVQCGKTTAMLRGAMKSVDARIVYATCEHQKIHVPTQKGHLIKEFEIEWDREMGEGKAKL